ncbi:hypothetical protein D3C83_238890 [compost metagenome]
MVAPYCARFGNDDVNVKEIHQFIARQRLEDGASRVVVAGQDINAHAGILKR